LAKIAEDEARHAALASAISRWARGRLDARARARLDRARHRALRDLDRDLATEVPNSIVHGAGIPTAAQARALLDSLKGSSVPTRPD
ncbi:hypothetical protein, partial [Klebsiella pneumoniae]|uniref:hypothetical protein n=1 Tax=Klebsiella pneumoniae TaxID=573 RepID=UPI003EE39E16